MKKITSMILAIVLCLSMCAFAFADEIDEAGSTGSVPVTLTTEAATFKVSVPASLVVDVASDGTVSVSNSARIINYSKGPVKVTAVNITPAEGWERVDYSTNYTGIGVNAQKFGMSLEGSHVPTDGACDASVFPVIQGMKDHKITYSATVAVQGRALSSVNIANAVFTVGWAQD